MFDQRRGKIRLLHYSKRTEDACVDWATKFIVFHGKRHPRETGTAEIAAYLTYLAVERKLAASTQNQAFSATLFLYQQILEIELDRVEFLRAQRPERLLPNDQAQQRRGQSKLHTSQKADMPPPSLYSAWGMGGSPEPQATGVAS